MTWDIFFEAPGGHRRLKTEVAEDDAVDRIVTRKDRFGDYRVAVRRGDGRTVVTDPMGKVITPRALPSAQKPARRRSR